MIHDANHLIANPKIEASDVIEGTDTGPTISFDSFSSAVQSKVYNHLLHSKVKTLASSAQGGTDPNLKFYENVSRAYTAGASVTVGITAGATETIYRTAVTRVNKVAPNAPSSACNEAVIRYGLWLMETNCENTAAGGFFRSGAASILSPYIERRLT